MLSQFRETCTIQYCTINLLSITQDAIRMAGKEFGEHSSSERSNTPVTATGKAIQWNALRYMLSEVLVIFTNPKSLPAL